MEASVSRQAADESLRALFDRAGDLLRRGVAASREGRLKEAEGLYESGLALAREHRFERMEAAFVANLGTLKCLSGSPAEGLPFLEDARRLHLRLGNALDEGRVLVQLGPAYRVVGAYPEAIGALTQGIEILEGTGQDAIVAGGLASLATIYRAVGISDQAIRYAEEAIALVGEDGVSDGELHLLEALAGAYDAAGDLPRAFDAAERMLALARRFGRDAEIATALMVLGGVHFRAGRLDEAEASYRESLVLAADLDIMRVEFGSRLGLARILASRGESDRARVLAEPLVERGEHYGERGVLISLYELLAGLCEAESDLSGALTYFRRLDSLRQDLFDRETDVRVRHVQVAHELRRERERSAQVLRQLSQQVMESQEEERRRLARELHDDLGQRLALLAVELDMMAAAPPEAAEVARERAGALSDLARGIADDVSAISHRLHPAVLEQLGLIEAAELLCREMADAFDCDVSFHAEGNRDALAPDVALCLYRIVQEGLRNAVRHGRAPRASVSLVGLAKSVRLTLGDEGSGFDPDALDRPGLGLAGMRERVRHLGGRFSLRSRVGEGTSIEVSLPLARGAPEA